MYQQARAAQEWVAYHPSPEAAHVRWANWACFRPESGQTPPVGRPVHLSRREGLSRDLRGRYQFRVKNADGSVHGVETTLYEEELVRAMYTNEDSYRRLGAPFRRMLDVALAKGGPETVVESLYSVMASQKMDGGQNDTTLVNRTKVDWCIPAVVAVPELVESAATRRLKVSRPPITSFSDSRTSRPPVVSRVSPASRMRRVVSRSFGKFFYRFLCPVIAFPYDAQCTSHM